MYANLKVTVDGSTYHAWRVEVKDTGTIVYLDKQDGSGSYCIEGGVITFSPGQPVRISPDF